MNRNNLLQEIDNLTLPEKILLVEDIWDSIARSNAELPLPEWQRQELDQRYAEYKNGKTTRHDWQEVHAALRNQGR
ncbi:MAG: addiction module protein [Thermodesulfobacteriota bacterium]